jgi:putative restriction endonuclease
VERDDHVRAACFAALDVLRAEYGEDVPYVGGLDRGFAYQGRRVPFLNYQKGIYRAAVQRGRAALSINTSFKSPYADAATDAGFSYAYRAGAVDQPDNLALRNAHLLQVPVVYFIGTRPGVYRPIYPSFIAEDMLERREVLVAPGTMSGPLDDREPMPFEDPLARRYAMRETRVRLHQTRFRARVLPAYRERCAVCRLKEIQLLDAAHIAGDATAEGAPSISNGISLCTIHHRAFDHDLVGVAPDHRVHVARRLLEDDDGPMLELLKGFHGTKIEVPRHAAWRPDPELLELRFERFRERS